MDNKNVTVLRKILYAVESGDQTYGKQDYSAFAGVGANCDNEKAITIGAGQWYAGEAKELLYRIQRGNPKLFKDMDTVGLEADLLLKSWATYGVSAGSAKGKCIINIISTAHGKKCQDEYMEDQIQTYAKSIEKTYGTMPDSAMMECINILHQGGDNALKRILAKTAKPYTADKIYATLCLDPADSTPNQVGDYTDRQKAVINMIHNAKKKEDEPMANTTKGAFKAVELAESREGKNQYTQSNLRSQVFNGYSDCSSLWWKAYEKAYNIQIGSWTGAQVSKGTQVAFYGGKDHLTEADYKKLQVGDLIYFGSGDAKHVEGFVGWKNGVPMLFGHGSGTPSFKNGLTYTHSAKFYQARRFYTEQSSSNTSSGTTTTTDAEKKQNTVAYVARITKDCKCYSKAGGSQAKLFPLLKKDSVVDVMKYTETVNGKKWYFVRIPHPTEGFVNEFVPSGYFKKLI